MEIWRVTNYILLEPLKWIFSLKADHHRVVGKVVFVFTAVARSIVIKTTLLASK